MLRNYSYLDFPDAEMLAKLKRDKRISATLVIPALNEAANIGPVVTAAKENLFDSVPLLDEIIVIDGGSIDATSEIAASNGATVYSLENAGPSVACRGKGTSLWKSQFVSAGDIIVFVDADILNFDPRFITGLLGPLICNDELYLAKAFYRRPLILGEGYYENFGGRVTEIMVRPLLCTFIPELARIYQPLAGEYAFRRTAMQQISFSSGYGVEIGLLFDVFRTFGLHRIAQVDMDLRCHRNRNVAELGKMSFGVLQVLLKRLCEHGYISTSDTMHSKMIAPVDASWEETIIEEVDLPSFNTIREGTTTI